MPIFSPYEIYQYPDAMLKHLPEKTLKMIKKTMLYSNKTVSYNKSTIDRRTYNSTMPADITKNNLDDRIDKFQIQIKIEFVYRIPLCYFTDVGKINFPLKIDFKIKCHLETEMKKIFESKKRVTAIGVPDAKIIFIKVPFIQYKQFLLDKNFRQYFETIIILKNSCQWAFKNHHCKKHMKCQLA